jgi:hypothetical protein
MKTTFLPAAWCKNLLLNGSPTPTPARPRRSLRLDPLLMVPRAALVLQEEEDTAYDGTWHESSRALARGLWVREWGTVGPDSHDTVRR